MGLLDDAIREHLELKRKHGAAEEEIKRQESEALGPARRDFAPAEPADEPEPDSAPVAAEEPAVAEPPTWLDEEEPEAEPAPEPIEHAAEAVDETVVQAPIDVPTQDFDALSADEPEEGEAEDEDVLEETPDFLQDTPEHDRLWFEQKPPRDFDFDG